MAQIWENTDIERFLDRAEDQLIGARECILLRTSLTIVSGTATYAVPDDTRSIRRVTWKGQKLDALPDRHFREVFQAGGQSGKPQWYIYNNLTIAQIKFYPTPAENIAPGTDLWGSDISTSVIVEYWAASDHDTNVIPAFLARRTKKAGALAHLFRMESKGQDLKMAEYYKAKFEYLTTKYTEILDELSTLPRKLILTGGFSNGSAFPASPILPIDKYGIGVDTGE